MNIYLTEIKKSHLFPTVVIPIFGLKPDKNLSKIFPIYEKGISSLLENKEFRGEAGELLITPQDYIDNKRIVILGLGQEKKFDINKLKEIMGKLSKTLQTKKIKQFHLYIPDQCVKIFSLENLVKNTVISIHIATYQFNSYITDKSRKMEPLEDVSFIFNANQNKNKFLAAVHEGTIIGEAINFTRHLGNLPPYEMTPSYMAREAKKFSEKNKKLKVEILDKNKIEKEKMGGLIGVSRGSSEEPRFIILEWNNAPKKYGYYVFIGKAITFDAGGISIKPSEKMDEMKFDMLGGGAVLGAFKAIMGLNLKINLVGLIPSCENLPDAMAYRPGDILTIKNGKTVEVLNTDAEGRIILADALSFADRYKPKTVIDLATLTGAVVYALGENYAGLFTRDKKIANLITTISKDTGENIWQLPLDDSFADTMKSKIADIKNISQTRYGGASTGAAFLEYFATFPWAHLDIAGVSWGEENVCRYHGATGYGVQLLVEIAKKWQMRK